jgi:hypothetical protein
LDKCVPDQPENNKEHPTNRSNKKKYVACENINWRNNMSFQKGNQLGKLKSMPKVFIGSVKNYFTENTDWSVIHKTLFKLAKGGQFIVNGNTGKKYKAQPSLDAIKILLEYSFGKPTQAVTTDDNTADAMKAFTDFVKGVNTPTAINTDGQLVSNSTDSNTNQYIDELEVVESERIN